MHWRKTQMIDQEKFGNPVVVVIFITLLDQVTKYFVRISLMANEYFSLITNFLGFTYVSNSGSLFGIFQKSNPFLVLFSVIALGAIMYYWEDISREDMIPFSMIAGGILGNLIDRVVYDRVTDFIAFSFWPAFNVADSAITIGIVWL